MLYVKPKVRLSRIEDNNYLLKLRCDCAVTFVCQACVEGVKKRGLKKGKSAIIDHRDLVNGEGSIGCVAKLAIGGVSIDNQLTSGTSLPLWK